MGGETKDEEGRVTVGEFVPALICSGRISADHGHHGQ